ncbi:MAG TPA: hypothetical protein VF762_18675 [Blastocatellia bacterium]|jgi:hypothetical protein
MGVTLINNHRQPITLDDGTILAAAGSPGCQKEVAEISARDRRRHVDTGRIAVVDEPQTKLASPARKPKEETK